MTKSSESQVLEESDFGRRSKDFQFEQYTKMNYIVEKDFRKQKQGDWKLSSNRFSSVCKRSF